MKTVHRNGMTFRLGHDHPIRSMVNRLTAFQTWLRCVGVRLKWEDKLSIQMYKLGWLPWAADVRGLAKMLIV